MLLILYYITEETIINLAIIPHCLSYCIVNYSFYLGRGREREREGEKHQGVVASHTPPTGDLVPNPGMCPDWESNQ